MEGKNSTSISQRRKLLSKATTYGHLKRNREVANKVEACRYSQPLAMTRSFRRHYQREIHAIGWDDCWWVYLVFTKVLPSDKFAIFLSQIGLVKISPHQTTNETPIEEIQGQLESLNLYNISSLQDVPSWGGVSDIRYNYEYLLEEQGMCWVTREYLLESKSPTFVRR